MVFAMNIENCCTYKVCLQHTPMFSNTCRPDTFCRTVNCVVRLTAFMFIWCIIVLCTNIKALLTYIGIITNAKKMHQTGKVVGTFAHGTRKVYDFINDNPAVGK